MKVWAMFRRMVKWVNREKRIYLFALKMRDAYVDARATEMYVELCAKKYNLTTETDPELADEIKLAKRKWREFNRRKELLEQLCQY